MHSYNKYGLRYSTSKLSFLLSMYLPIQFFIFLYLEELDQYTCTQRLKAGYRQHIGHIFVNEK